MPGAILFDVDGTLLDTNYLHIIAWSRAFRDQGHLIPMADIHEAIGMGTDRLLERLVGTRPPELSSLHAQHYRALRSEVRVLPGAVRLLREVRRRQPRVVLATSAEPAELGHAIDLLEAAGVAVVSAGEVSETKPAPEIFARALERMGAAAAESVAVGDTVWDVQAALRLGLPCAGLLTGGISREALEAAGAVAVYEGTQELCDRLGESVLAPLLG